MGLKSSYVYKQPKKHHNSRNKLLSSMLKDFNHLPHDANTIMVTNKILQVEVLKRCDCVT